MDPKKGSQIFDLRHQDLMEDPAGALAQVYAHFGIELRESARDAILIYLKAKPKGKHGRHRYSFRDTGLNESALRGRFAAYVERYGIALEAQ